MLRVVDSIDADWDGDGVVTLNDVFAFIADWQAGDADVNSDGETNFDDVIDFLGAWGEQP